MMHRIGAMSSKAAPIQSGHTLALLRNLLKTLLKTLGMFSAKSVRLPR
jgi:hypothetical protein